MKTTDIRIVESFCGVFQGTSFRIRWKIRSIFQKDLETMFIIISDEWFFKSFHGHNNVGNGENSLLYLDLGSWHFYFCEDFWLKKN